jgi:hypothetical protein
MLPEGLLVSRVPTPLQSVDLWSSITVLEFHSPPAGDGCERRAVRPTHAPSPSECARDAAVGARAGGAQEGEEDPARVRSSGCVSSRVSPPLGLRSTRRRTRRGRAIGDGLPREVGAFAPLSQSRGGGRGDDAWGGRGSARHQAAYERGDARRRGAGACRWDDWGRGGGHAGGGYSARQALEEEEAGLLHPELGDRSLISVFFRSARA